MYAWLLILLRHFFTKANDHANHIDNFFFNGFKWDHFLHMVKQVQANPIPWKDIRINLSNKGSSPKILPSTSGYSSPKYSYKTHMTHQLFLITNFHNGSDTTNQIGYQIMGTHLEELKEILKVIKVEHYDTENIFGKYFYKVLTNLRKKLKVVPKY
jgi:hypothetical protein